MDIPELKTEEWIKVLDPYQQELIKELLVDNSEETAMDIWLTVSGPEFTTTFGGTGKNDYLKSFKQEFDKFILGDEKYHDIIKKLDEYSTVSSYLLVSFLSTALAESLGVATCVVAPLIVLALGTIGRIGLNAYRNTIYEDQKKTKDSEKNLKTVL